jgi:6,7-dimethyl-8-ribityllumazine synthase
MASSGKSEINDTGTFIKKGACVVIVRTEWNSEIVDKLEEGCKQKLIESGIENIIVLNIPGAVEIPFAIKHCWEKLKQQEINPDAFIALGTVIQGDTPHFDYVCKMVADGILQLNLTLPVPTIFGVLTVNNKQQALDRIGGKDGHKGEEAADAAVKMIQLFDTIANFNS